MSFHENSDQVARVYTHKFKTFDVSSTIGRALKLILINILAHFVGQSILYIFLHVLKKLNKIIKTVAGYRARGVFSR